VVLGDRDPKTVTPEQLLALRTKVTERVSTTEAHRVIKVWRALWKKLRTFRSCTDKTARGWTPLSPSPTPR
jgi:hypothetical protein